jgi:hypothetical protein
VLYKNQIPFFKWYISKSQIQTYFFRDKLPCKGQIIKSWLDIELMNVLRERESNTLTPLICNY